MSEGKSVAELWTEIKLTVESLEKDVARNVEKGNVSAGVRVRKGARKIKALCADLVRTTTQADKQVSEARKTEKKE